jgi:hypothetical protein
MSSWPVPSLVRTKGTWLEEFAKAELWSRQTLLESQFGLRLLDRSVNPVDAFLYLGPPDLLLATQPSLYGFGDKDYVTELRRRQTAAGGSGTDARTDPDQVRAREGEVFLCEVGRSK